MGATRSRRWVAVLVLGYLGVARIGAGQTADDLFEPDTIRDVHLTLAERDWATLKRDYLLNTYYTADLRLVLSDAEVIVRNVGLRSRGTGSRSPIKPALKIDVGRYVKGQRALGLRSIILRNQVQDASMLKEHVTFALQRRLGLRVPRTVFARLFVNGTYTGLYEIAEDVDEEFLDRVAGEHGGYLFEYAWTRPYFLEYLGPDPAVYAPLWEPQTREDDPPALLYGPFVALSRVLADTPPEQFESAVAPHVDTRDVLRLAAADNFMADWDGMLGYAGLNNIYFYRPAGGPGFVIPWDKDNTFHDLDYWIWEGAAQNALTARALRIPSFRAAYVATLREAAAVSRAPVALSGPGGVLRVGWLEALVESTARLIRKSVWADPNKPTSNEAFEAAVTEARRFARLRADVVEAQLGAE